ncbi:hypothetical protein DPX16_6367 [Anabarilius grahami]|uniref:Tc1-like transposase DDE domain-containing protein n=1 Tax=Anabarilius grahami TaxID=495550 RepID=A0A3N0YUU9_ANAGA|nr:hypothetical protein DPX16_6367 [Anabarilius grahami]
MADSMHGVVWVSGLLMSTLWIELPMVAVGLWFGKAYVMDNKHRICTQFLEAENIPVLAWPAYSPDMSPIEHVWDALDRRIYDSVFQFLPISSNFAQPLKRSGPTFHRPQSTT